MQKINFYIFHLPRYTDIYIFYSIQQIFRDDFKCVWLKNFHQDKIPFYSSCLQKNRDRRDILSTTKIFNGFFFSTGPKILQAILSAICDTTAIKMFPILMSNSKEKLWIYIALYSSNWFLLYASSR